MLNPTTTEPLWAAIRRMERRVAERARRTGTTTPPTAATSARSATRAEPAPGTGPGPVASVVPLLPPLFDAGPAGIGTGPAPPYVNRETYTGGSGVTYPGQAGPTAGDAHGDRWVTVAESVAPAAPWLSLHARMPTAVVPPGGRPVDTITARVTVEGAEVWRGPVTALAAPVDGYAVVGPVPVPVALVDPLSVRHVRVQTTAAPPPGTGPAWLVWHHAE